MIDLIKFSSSETALALDLDLPIVSLDQSIFRYFRAFICFGLTPKLQKTHCILFSYCFVNVNQCYPEIKHKKDEKQQWIQSKRIKFFFKLRKNIFKIVMKILNLHNLTKGLSRSQLVPLPECSWFLMVASKGIAL